MLDTANEKMELNGPTASLNFTLKYLDHCIKVLLSALRNLSRTIPLAGEKSSPGIWTSCD